MAPGTTWRVKDVSVLQGCRSSTCISISWQKLHLCTHSISRTGWKPDALLCTMQLTPWDVYMKDTVMMGFILRRWLIGSLQCCPFHATLWKEKKISYERRCACAKALYEVYLPSDLWPGIGPQRQGGRCCQDGPRTAYKTLLESWHEEEENERSSLEKNTFV